MGQDIFHIRPTFHHELDLLEYCDVGEWVALNRNQIGIFPCLDRAHAVCQPSNSAALTVAARIASRGGMPRLVSATNYST